MGLRVDARTAAASSARSTPGAERRAGAGSGRPVPLKEDARLIAGRGRFVDDLARPRMLHAAMLRSPHAHARIVADRRARGASAARRRSPCSPAREAARAAPARSARSSPPIRAVPDYCLAVDRARYVGEPVAAVAAVDRATAEDALERIAVEYEPLPAVVDPEAAIAPGRAARSIPSSAPTCVWHDTLTYGDVDGAFARADGVLRERFEIQRYASTPLETFGGIAEYDAGHRRLRVLDERPAPRPHDRQRRWPRRSACRRRGSASRARTSAGASATSAGRPTCSSARCSRGRAGGP